MTTKPVQYENDATSIPAVTASKLPGMIGVARQLLSALFRRIERESAIARIDALRARQAQRRQQQAIGELPLEEKHRLGLYHLMD